MTPESHKRLQDLLADLALWGLSDSEARELESLRAEAESASGTPDPSHHESQEEREYAEIAALTAFGMSSTADRVPSALIQELESEALGFVASRKGISTEMILDAVDSVEYGPKVQIGDSNRAAPATIAWLPLAAAAAIVVALIWVGFMRDTQVRPSRARESMIAQAPKALRMDWTQGPSQLAGSASGDIIWSDDLQTGYMRFRGLPVNDPNAQQYQLWIFDETRDAAKPIDGGVFDITEVRGNGDLVVPIRAALRVGRAVAFAVTVEQPGGVVVSDREHIVASAGL